MTDTTASPALGSAAGPPETVAEPRPPASAPRHQTLDTVRGVAVMGILAMNIVGFAMSGAAYLNPMASMAYGNSSVADLWSWVFSFVFIDGRMRGLFSFLFGASMLLVIERAEASGRSPAGVHYARMVWLLVFGLIHLWLIWWGDILSLYAPVGMIAYAFRRCRAKTLIIWGVALLVLSFGFMALNYVGFGFMQAAAAAPGASAAAVEQWQGLQNSFGIPTAQFVQEDLALYRGPYSGLLANTFPSHLLGPVQSLILFGPETLAYFLFGMAAFRNGFLTGTWSDAAYKRVMLTGFGIGWPILALLAWAQYAAGFAALPVFLYGLVLTILPRPIVILAVAALVIVLTRSNGPLTQRISATGRAAFSNYLGTSILMTFFFYGWGLGYYGYLSRIQLWLVVIVMWAVMLAWSKPWLDRFAYGPLEWLWRSLSRWQVQSMRKAAAA